MKERNSSNDAIKRVHPLTFFYSLKALSGAYLRWNPSEGLHLFFCPLFNHKISKMKIIRKHFAGDISPPLCIFTLFITQLKLIIKKSTLLILVLFIFITSTYCQITKGNWIIGGSASFLTNKSIARNSNSVSGFNQSSLNINPGVGYFFINKFAGGLRLIINFDKVVAGTSSNSPTYYGIGPFARYYFLPIEKQVNIFSEVAYSYYARMPYVQNQKSDSYFVEVGSVVYFNSSVGLEFTLAYSNSKSYSIISKTFQIVLGFQIHLEKQDK